MQSPPHILWHHAPCLVCSTLAHCLCVWIVIDAVPSKCNGPKLLSKHAIATHRQCNMVHSSDPYRFVFAYGFRAPYAPYLSSSSSSSPVLKLVHFERLRNKQQTNYGEFEAMTKHTCIIHATRRDSHSHSYEANLSSASAYWINF